ncbi:MAG TPA: TonB-dependent siderophore receptor [Terracidiphilus sp.]|jgi:iron complex outermembrane receptor protein|nr:TonB-dependent siderophore receptor [Terracidiphilus sp.]
MPAVSAPSHVSASQPRTLISLSTPPRISARRHTLIAWLGCVGLFVPSFLLAQNPAAPAPPQQPTNPPAQSTNPPAQTIPRVTTTVVVHGEAKDDYRPDVITAGTLDSAPLAETPVSAAVITRELLTDQDARTLAEVVKNDASVGEDYAPVGYYGDFEIRGFPIDLATGLQINGLTVAGEQDVPLENKERVEIVNGLAGVESGVASSGGLIDFVTKRPATIKAVDVATDHRGSSFGAVDLGRLFGNGKQVGARLNLAGEKIQSYVNDANGWRAVGAGAADWKINSKATWKNDFEYQHKVERSVSGYQLLGGTTIPSLDKVFPSTMLGEQSWSKPNTFDTFNTGTRLDYDLPGTWHAFIAGSFSHSLIDDNVVYAYGCYYEAQCQGNGGTAPDYFFAPDGGYDIYDYRNPGELRIDAQGEAIVIGHIKTGAVTHDVAAGGELFLRSVQMPGFYTKDNPTAPDGTGRDGAVYYFVGSENIYQPVAPVDLNAAESPIQSAGPRRLWEDNHQSAAVLQDRIHLPGRIELLASGRFDSLRDHNYSAYASCFDFSVPGACLPILTDKHVWLPDYAITFHPVSKLTLYANYGVLLSLGPQAPFWTDNGSAFLSPFFTRQAEIGAKYEPGQRILLTTALFRMRAPFFYPKVIQSDDSFCSGVNPGDLCFESDGHETHDGIEVNAEGKAANWLRLNASIAAIHAISQNTGTPAFDNKQVINVPRVRTALFADVALPHARGLHLMPGWGYSASKDATRDDAVSVPGFNLFNLGARYTVGGEQGHTTLRVYADNITDKRYWKDTGASYGDTFIHLGAPTTVRLSAHYTF